MKTSIPGSIDEYIAGFPEDTQKVLQAIRVTIKQTVPEAEESISYAMPTFTFGRNYLVYFAAFKNHIGLYPAPTGDEVFEKELSLYKSGKGTVQFPLNKPVPLDLVVKIVELRLKESQGTKKTRK
jgi:uncharacterized protein YdhG (YjbR/CyaY superfamily)